MKRLIVAASVAVILMISAIALVVINADDTATASQTDTTQPQTDTTQPQTDTTQPQTEVPLPEFMEDHLQDLVERGFITEEQVDEMERRFREHAPWNGELPDDFDPEHFMERFRERGPWNGELPDDFDPEHFMGPGFGPHGFGFFGGDEDLAELFGITPEELSDALDNRTPPTDLIDDPEAFIDAIVGHMEDGLNQAVESGLLTQAEADELIAEARSHAEAFLNGGGFEGEGFMGRRGPRGSEGFWGFGEFGPHAWFDADAEPAGSSA